MMTAIQVAPATAVTPATRTLRVLHVINGEHYAGAERVQDLLAQYLVDQDVEVGFACVKADQFPLRRHYGHSPLWQVPVRHPWDRQGIAAVTRLAREFDLVHSHTPRAAWAAVPAARRAGIPAVHTLHDVSLGQSGSRAGSWTARLVRHTTVRLLRDVSSVIGVSPATLEIAEQWELGRQRRFVPNGVPCRPRFQDRATPTHWVLGTVALMRPCKGVEVLLRAAARLVTARVPLALKLIGTFETPAYEKSLRQLVSQLCLNDHVEFTGFAGDVDRQLDQLDLFILPSLAAEGLPMVVMEAMASGLPVVGSRVPGISDLVRDGVDGTLCTPQDPEALAAAIQRIVEGQVDWQAARMAAYRRQRALFSAERMAARTADLYKSLIDQ